ncbi:MAG: AGE family epimerase/isomerase [Spirochaetota bacterium]
MTATRIEELRDFYLRELTEDTIPFWIGHGIDREQGGLLDFLDRQGRVLSTDKGGWIQGRFTWVLSRLIEAYGEKGVRPEWLEAARLCADFVRDRVLSGPGGRAYYELTREGKPLVLRRYLFSETFAIIALAQYAKATGDRAYLDKALATLAVLDANRGKLEPKIDPTTRRMRGHSETMILINVHQVLREALRARDPRAVEEQTRRIDVQIEELFRYFVRPERRALLETVNYDGSIAEGLEGTCINPGHAIETAWFLMEEGRWRGDYSLVERSLPLLEWSLERGWDPVYGGLFSFVDLEGGTPAQIEWDMKYWWPHCEATYACLLAWALTGEARWERWFETLHEYTWKRFPDPVHGEWFGYLRRDGSVANDLKGNHFKGAFHVPRFELYSGILLDALATRGRGFEKLKGADALLRLSGARS